MPPWPCPEKVVTLDDMSLLVVEMPTDPCDVVEIVEDWVDETDAAEQEQSGSSDRCFIWESIRLFRSEFFAMCFAPTRELAVSKIVKAMLDPNAPVNNSKPQDQWDENDADPFMLVRGRRRRRAVAADMADSDSQEAQDIEGALLAQAPRSIPVGSDRTIGEPLCYIVERANPK